MRLAGVQVRHEDVLDLAWLLRNGGFDDTAEALIVALEAEQALVALSIADREAILRTLDDPPIGLADSAVCSFASYEWRVREGWSKPRPGTRVRRVGLSGLGGPGMLWLGVTVLLAGVVSLSGGLR
jgi:hypothetical protein